MSQRPKSWPWERDAPLLGKQADLIRYCLKRTEKEVCDLLEAKLARIRRLEQIPADQLTETQYKVLKREDSELNVISGTYALIDRFGNECADLLSRADALQTSYLQERATLEKEVIHLRHRVAHLEYRIRLQDEHMRQQETHLDFLAALAQRGLSINRKEVVHEL